jgi:hypothetical protein
MVAFIVVALIRAEVILNVNTGNRLMVFGSVDSGSSSIRSSRAGGSSVRGDASSCFSSGRAIAVLCHVDGYSE